MGVSCILVLALKDQGWSCIDWEREKKCSATIKSLDTRFALDDFL